MVEELKGEFTIEAEEGLKALQELNERFKELGYEIEVPLKKKFAEHIILMEDVKRVWGDIKKLPKEYQKAYAEMVEDLKEKGVLQVSTMEKISKGISENVGTVVEESKKSILKGLQDIVPKELQYLGIWGLLIGASLFALEKFKTAGAMILEDWARMTDGLRSTADRDLKRLALTVGETARFIHAEFEFILSDEDVKNVMSNLSILTKGFTDFGEDQRKLIIETAKSLSDLEALFGVTFGTLSKRFKEVSLLLSPIGTVETPSKMIRTFTEDMNKLAMVAKGVGIDFGTLYGVFSDVGTKAGEFGLSARTLVDIVGTFATQAKNAGMSLLEYKKGVTELLPAIAGFADPFKIVFMTSALGGTISPEKALYEFERMKVLGPSALGAGGPDFEKTLFRGLVGVIEKVGIMPGMRPEEISRRLEVLGMPANLRVFLSDLAERRGDLISFLKDAAEGRAPVMTKEIRKDIEAIKEIMRQEEPAWMRLLKSTINLIVDILTFISSLVGEIAMFVAGVAKEGIFAKGPIKEAAGKAIEETISLMVPTITAHAKEAGKALVDIPGLSAFATVIEALGKIPVGEEVTSAFATVIEALGKIPVGEEVTKEKIRKIIKEYEGLPPEEVRKKFAEEKGKGVKGSLEYAVTPQGIVVPIQIPYEAIHYVIERGELESEGK